jgi:hypothetical protein
MDNALTGANAYVVKTADLAALDQIIPDRPAPIKIEWINRGTNRKMQRSTVELLLRTRFRENVSPSVSRLRESAGMRLIFRDEREREVFAAKFAKARAQLNVPLRYLIAAMFEKLEDTSLVVAELKRAGVPGDAIYMSWHSEDCTDTDERVEGHSKRSVAAAVVGGGVTGVVFAGGILVLASPAFAVGAIAASSIGTVAGVSAALGATGGAMARMLSDPDVEGRAANDFGKYFQLRKVLVSVDTRIAEGLDDVIEQTLLRLGGSISINQ